MESSILVFIIVVLSFSIISAGLLLAYVFRGKWRLGREIDAANQSTGDSRNAKTQSRKWGQIITFYLLLCMIFIGIILYQAGQGMEERTLDFLAVLVGAIFFIIQAALKRSAEKRRERATARTTATLVETKRSVGSDSTNSIYEFYAQGVTQRVSSPGVYGVNIGEQVELYYAPQYPKIIYIPRVEESARRSTFIFEIFLYIIGIVLPLFGLTAPLFR